MSENLLYVARGDKDSERAIKMLAKCGVRFQKIIVGRDGNGKSMWRDIGTTEIPTLLSSKGTLIGIREIGKFCKK
jgi:hypothetical protein